MIEKFEARQKTSRGGAAKCVLEVVRHVGQIHVYSTDRQHITRQVAAYTFGEWLNLDYRDMTLHQAGITSYTPSHS